LKEVKLNLPGPARRLKQGSEAVEQSMESSGLLVGDAEYCVEIGEVDAFDHVES
jgi:hypothetical protein